MIAALVVKSAISMKKEVSIVLIVIGVLLGLPMIAVFSLTSVGALNEDGTSLYTGNASTTNTYEYGFCTFWTAARREQVGKPIPNNWGDAHTWDDGAKKASYTVDHTPSQYAIMETDAGDLGHVAFVEEVNPNGSWKVSEMNVKGWDILSDRTFKAEQAKNYNFIH
ncbi:MAG: CHAP domain-containing protein [Candidatus Saccharimonadales bacterium]